MLARVQLTNNNYWLVGHEIDVCVCYVCMLCASVLYLMYFINRLYLWPYMATTKPLLLPLPFNHFSRDIHVL